MRCIRVVPVYRILRKSVWAREGAKPFRPVRVEGARVAGAASPHVTTYSDFLYSAVIRIYHTGWQRGSKVPYMFARLTMDRTRLLGMSTDDAMSAPVTGEVRD